MAAVLVVAGSLMTTGACAPNSSESEAVLPLSADALADRYDSLFPDDRVQTVRILMPQSDWDSMRADPRAKEYFRSDIWFDGQVVKNVAVRTKGNSSLMQGSANGKFGLKVDFNFFNADQTYHGIKKLSFNNGFSDPTLMKEFLGYELMALMGVPTPRACFVDLWLNEDHLGVYTQVEAVDSRFAGDNFGSRNGNLYKPELAAGRLDWTEDDAAAQSSMRGSTATTARSLNIGGGDLEEIIARLGEDAGWIPGRSNTSTSTSISLGGARPPGGLGGIGGLSDLLTSVGLKTNEDRADHSHLYDLLEVLNSPANEVSAADLEKVLDVDEVLRFLAVSAALVHLDNYIGVGHNYYLYDDGGRFSIIPWDLNMCFGGFNSNLAEDRLLAFFIDEPTSGPAEEYPLVEQLLAEPEFLSTYHTYLRQLLEGPFSVPRMTARIDEIAALIRPYIKSDDRLSLQHFDLGLREDLPPGSGSVMGGQFIGLEHFVEERVASIGAQLSGAQPARSDDGSGNGGAVGIGRPGMGPLPGQGGPAARPPARPLPGAQPDPSDAGK